MLSVFEEELNNAEKYKFLIKYQVFVIATVGLSLNSTYFLSKRRYFTLRTLNYNLR